MNDGLDLFSNYSSHTITQTNSPVFTGNPQDPFVATKRCSYCLEIKPVSKFRKDKRTSRTCLKCRQCEQKLYDRNRKPRKQRYKQKTYISNAAKRIARKYGQRTSEAYLSLVASKQVPVRAKISTVISKALGIDSSRRSIDRLIFINHAAKFDAMNIGWSCAKCGTYSTLPLFFDVDHIVPISKGGKNHPDNYQILCPNCHRRKTINDLHADNIFASSVTLTASHGEKPVDAASVQQAQYMPILLRENTLAECQFANHERDNSIAAALSEPNNSLPTPAYEHPASIFAPLYSASMTNNAHQGQNCGLLQMA